MTICRRCVLDDSVADLRLDADGVCNYCHAFDARRSPAETETLERLVTRIKDHGRGRTYDCVIGLSGGIDSSYATLTAVRLGLRPLIVHVDNGWNTELAVKNIESIVRGLKVDLVTYVIDWEEFRGLQLSLLRAGVVDLELVSDHAIIAGMYRAARRHRIGFIVTGDNHATEATLPAGWNHRKTDLRNIRAINRAFERATMKTFPTLSTLEMVLHNRLLRLEYVGLLSYVDYRKETAFEELEKAVGYRRYAGKHFESIITRFYQGYILPTKFGIDKRRFHFSLLVHSGQMTRDEALAELTKPPYDPELARADKLYVCKKLRISVAELDALMKTTPKSHFDYPSDDRLIKTLQRTLGAAKRLRERLVA